MTREVGNSFYHWSESWIFSACFDCESAVIVAVSLVALYVGDGVKFVRNTQVLWCHFIFTLTWYIEYTYVCKSYTVLEYSL